MSDFYQDIVKAVPEFDSGKCGWIHQLAVWETEIGKCCRIVICYEDRLDLSLVATGVREITLGNRERTPGALPYAPYDLGEFFIMKSPTDGRYILADELKGWRIVADLWELEGVFCSRHHPK